MALTKISSNVIANNTIAVGNIADNSVDATKIASNSILTRHIDDDQITTDQIAANTIATANIADNAVDGTKIASNSILTRHIDDNQIGIDQLNVSDGSNGQFLKTDGSGTLSFGTVNTTTALDDIATGDAASTLATSTGNITLDSPANIKLNADGGQIAFEDGSTEIGVLENSSSDFKIESKVQDKNIVFAGNDNGSGITALTLDMSEAGKATFNNGIISTAAAGQTQLQLTDSTNSKSAFLNYNNDTIEFFMNGPTERLRIYSNGNIAASGGIILGAGLAQTAANTLDDYEEGTFTPVYTATGLSVTHDIQNGLYTKIGDTVNFWILLGTDAKSGSSSSYILTITGLPYACKNTASSFASGSVGLAYTWAANEQSMKWFIGANTSIISLYAGDSNTGAYITPADMGTTANDNRLYISGCYKTD